MYRSRRELPGDIYWPDFLHPRQREERTADIMRLSSASPFDGSAREESGKVWKTSKTIKRQDENPKPNKVDRIDDKIRLASKWVEVLATARPPSKALRLPAWRPIHWIRPFDRISLLSFLRGEICLEKRVFENLSSPFYDFIHKPEQNRFQHIDGIISDSTQLMSREFAQIFA